MHRYTLQSIKFFNKSTVGYILKGINVISAVLEYYINIHFLPGQTRGHCHLHLSFSLFFVKINNINVHKKGSKIRVRTFLFEILNKFFLRNKTSQLRGQKRIDIGRTVIVDRLGKFLQPSLGDKLGARMKKNN